MWRLPIDALEANPPPAVPSHAHAPLAAAQKAEPTLRVPTIAGRPATPAQDKDTKDKERETKPQTKKPRASRLPKHVTPNSPPPDPERWLKKSERSTFQSRTRKRGGGGGGGGGRRDWGRRGLVLGGMLRGPLVVEGEEEGRVLEEGGKGRVGRGSSLYVRGFWNIRCGAVCMWLGQVVRCLLYIHTSIQYIQYKATIRK